MHRRGRCVARDPKAVEAHKHRGEWATLEWCTRPRCWAGKATLWHPAGQPQSRHRCPHMYRNQGPPHRCYAPWCSLWTPQPRNGSRGHPGISTHVTHVFRSITITSWPSPSSESFLAVCLSEFNHLPESRNPLTSRSTSLSVMTYMTVMTMAKGSCCDLSQSCGETFSSRPKLGLVRPKPFHAERVGRRVWSTSCRTRWRRRLSEVPIVLVV